MASWITHLRIAGNILQLIPELEAASFAVGSIAPDSGIPDAKWEKFDPPPDVTHYSNHPGADHKLADLESFQQHLLPLRGDDAQGLVSFRMGYFFHLVTDNLWNTRIGLPTQQRFSTEFTADKDFIWEVKKDWYGLDFLYLHSRPECLIWHIFMQAQVENGDLDFLPLEAVRQRVAYIREYYQRTGAELQNAYNRPYIYLPRTRMDQFVDEASSILSRIYNCLWLDGADTNGSVSALDMELIGE